MRSCAAVHSGALLVVPVPEQAPGDGGGVPLEPQLPQPERQHHGTLHGSGACDTALQSRCTRHQAHVTMHMSLCTCHYTHVKVEAQVNCAEQRFLYPSSCCFLLVVGNRVLFLLLKCMLAKCSDHLSDSLCYRYCSCFHSCFCCCHCCNCFCC